MREERVVAGRGRRLVRVTAAIAAVVLAAAGCAGGGGVRDGADEGTTS